MELSSLDRGHFRALIIGAGQAGLAAAHELWRRGLVPGEDFLVLDATWDLEVEQSVRESTSHGQAPGSVVRTTGIPQAERYLQGVADGVLVSRGMFDRVTPSGVVFGSPLATTTGGVGPAAHDELQVPESWDPYPPGTEVGADVIFWNTGFRHSLRHLAPLKLREPGGGILMDGEVRVAKNPRVLLVGYGSTASTVGATRAGRRAGQAAVRYLEESR